MGCSQRCGSSRKVLMISGAKILEGLPSYGPPAIALPAEWGTRGHEGLVVEFATDTGSWIGNFQLGLGGLRFAGLHPNGQDAIVIAKGDLWIVHDQGPNAQRLLHSLTAMIEVQDPSGWIFSRQDVALVRLAPDGVRWHTRRISWDGFKTVAVNGSRIEGFAWSPLGDKWIPFEVEIQTGKAVGGSYRENDVEDWEHLYAIP